MFVVSNRPMHVAGEQVALSDEVADGGEPGILHLHCKEHIWQRLEHRLPTSCRYILLLIHSSYYQINFPLFP